MIAIEQSKEGLVITLRAYPNGRRDAIKGELGGALAVATTKAPERGKANEALLEIVAQALDLPRSRLELLSGESARRKRVLIGGLTRAELEARLQRVLAQ